MNDEKMLLNDQQIYEIIDQLADKICQEFPGKGDADFALIGIQVRGVLFAERLKRSIEKNHGFTPEMGTLDINMYRDDIGMKDKLPVIHETDIPFDLNGRDIILVDDVLATGRTIRAALDALTGFGRPGLIRLAVLVDRDAREFPIRADYAGAILKDKDDRRVKVCWQEINNRDCVLEVEWNKK